MIQELKDRTGQPVTVGVSTGDPVNAYTVSFGDAEPVGRAYFVDSPKADHERIFFHTEVDAQYGGRGLAGLLVREALAESIREGITVVPVCPLFARHLAEHGNEFVAAGGAYRMPTPADTLTSSRAARLPR